METELWKQSYRLPNNLFAIGPTIFELWVMETENWVMKIGNPNNLIVSHSHQNRDKLTWGPGPPNIPKRNFFIYNITKTQDKMELGPPYFKSLPLLQN